MIRPLKVILFISLIGLTNVEEAFPYGGSSGNGGGGGVACFGRAMSDAEVYGPNNTLKASARSQIRSLQTLDVWEGGGEQVLEPTVDGESPEQYLIRVLDAKIAPLNPYLVSRIKEALKMVHVEQWNPIESPSCSAAFIPPCASGNCTDRVTVNSALNGLPRLDDLGAIKRPLPQQCKYVQLAIRHSQSEEGMRPVACVDADLKLIARMNVVNQASLMLHEALYLMGAEMYQKDSSGVRSLVAKLLSNEAGMHAWFNGQDLVSDRTRIISFQSALAAMGFGKFAYLYDKEIDRLSKVSGAPPNLRRQVVYGSMMYKSGAAGDGLDWFGTFTNEEALFAVWRWVAGKSGFQEARVESLEAFLLNPTDGKAQYNTVCQIVADPDTYRRFGLFDVHGDITQKAKAYCRSRR